MVTDTVIQYDFVKGRNMKLGSNPKPSSTYIYMCTTHYKQQTAIVKKLWTYIKIMRNHFIVVRSPSPYLLSDNKGCVPKNNAQDMAPITEYIKEYWTTCKM